MDACQNALHSAATVDQKDLNEAVVNTVAAVARQNIHHCAELFDIPVRLAQRFATMALQSEDRHSAVDPLEDLATTPTALWRVTMTLDDVAQMQRGPATGHPHLERYRGVVAALNQQVVLMLLRYATQPRLAALVSGLGSQAVMDAMSSASCSTLVQSAGNVSRPLVRLTVNEVYLDRVFSTLSGFPIDSTLRALVARTLCPWEDFVSISDTVDRELAEPRPARVTKIGRPTAVFLPPGEADTIRQLIAHGVSTRTILQFTRSEVNCAQVRRLRRAADEAREDTPPMALAPEVDLPRTHDSNAAVWGSAVRRLLVTSIFAHQRVLVSLGLPPHAAFVEAYEFYALHHKDPSNPLSLTRLISAVFSPMRDGLVHLGHCSECGTMHLSHDGHHNGIECPVCALAKFNKLGRPSTFRASVWAPSTTTRVAEAEAA